MNQVNSSRAALSRKEKCNFTNSRLLHFWESSQIPISREVK